MQCACLSLTTLVLSTDSYVVCHFDPSLHKYLTRLLMQCACLCLTTLAFTTDAYAVCLLDPSLRQYLVRTLMQCACLCLTKLVLNTDAYAVCLFLPHYVSTQYGRLCNVSLCASLRQYLVRPLMQCVCSCLTMLVLRTDAYAVRLFVPDYVSTQYGRLCSVSFCASQRQYLLRTLMQCVFLCLTTLVLSTDAYAVCLFDPSLRQYLVRTLMQCVCLCLTTLVLSTDAYAVCLFVPHYVSTQYGRLCSVSVCA